MQAKFCPRQLLVAAAMFIAPALSAQQITGRVVDQSSGQPMAAVQVSITGTGVGALSQATGRYLLLNVPVGTHTVTAQRIGYKTATASVTVTAGASRACSPRCRHQSAWCWRYCFTTSGRGRTNITQSSVRGWRGRCAVDWTSMPRPQRMSSS